jgi:hypothetical protein
LTEREFAIGDVSKSGFEDHNYAHKAREANQSEAKIRGGEVGPGFHVS